jgi:acetoin utilization deacetylase AcuC-like enzyme
MVAIFFSKKCFEHSQGPAHPECPERLTVLLEAIRSKKINLVEPKLKINEDELYIIHEKNYIEKLETYSKKGISFPDNRFYENTFEIAKFAAFVAKVAALNCEKEPSFALVRPPGHHAGKNFFAGFCYINNLAFAVKSLQKIKNEKTKKENKVMVIDIDYHAGNGSWDIFYEDNSVFFLDFHCNPRFAYPGTGFESENTNHMINVTFSPDTSDEEYIKKFEENVRKYFEIFKPNYVAVSIGFDTYYLDPIAGLGIKNSSTYAKLGKIIKSLEAPTFGTLEGGYYLPKLGENFLNFLSAFLE